MYTDAHPVVFFHPRSPPSFPASSCCSVLPSSADSMPGEIPGPPSIRPRHIGQVDGPRELLDVIGQVHSTGWGVAEGDLCNPNRQLPSASAYVDVPTICVLGDQSVGKSSVTEAISGTKALGTCTRYIIHPACHIFMLLMTNVQVSHALSTFTI